MTIDLRNARERLEAYKLIRRLFHLYPLEIPRSFVYVLDSIVSSSYLTLLSRPINSSEVFKSDQMVKCCLELLCEIGLNKIFSIKIIKLFFLINSSWKSTCITSMSCNKYNVKIYRRF